nr:unnamed protein product [Spirometra erinaceieuropaei]
MLESWSSTGTLNRAIDLHPAYQALRARLESVQAWPMARMNRATRGRPPTLAERGEGADGMSRARRGTPSHGRTREAGNTTPEKQRPISPPSDEGEANEHADAAATTSQDMGLMGFNTELDGEAFAVTNGVKQGCVLAPTLFSLMFSAMPMDAYRHERPGIRIAYRTDGHLLNQRRMHFQSRVSTTTVHELLFADDCALNTTSEKEMQRSMDLFSAAFKNFGLVINTQKKVVMHKPPPNTATPPNAPQISVNGTQLQVVENFPYLAVLSPTTPRSMTKSPTGSRKPVKPSVASKAQFGIATVVN